MGQKVHPIGLRLGIIRTWESNWYSEKDYAKFLHQDLEVRKFVKKKLFDAGLSKVEIERPASEKMTINIHTARPGIVIGQRGAKVEALKKEIEAMTGVEVFVNVHEVRVAEADAQLIAENIALQLERRIAFRRAMKRSVLQAMKFGVKGIKIRCSGRLGGAEMARTNWYREGRIPLHTLRADIDYGFHSAVTTYGAIGVKVWVFKKEILPEDQKEARR